MKKNDIKKAGGILKIFVVLFFAVLLSGCSDDWVCDIPFVCSDAKVNEAVETNDPDACDDLSYPDDPETELKRKNQCFKKVAMNTDDLDVCDRIVENESAKNDCIQKIALSLQDEVFCAGITDNERIKEKCYIDIAIAKGDESLCAESTSAQNEKKCYSEVAKIKKDASICDSIKLENNRAACYSQVAALIGDVEICKKITFGFERNKTACINALAVVKADHNVCDEHVTVDLQMQCVIKLANETRDVAHCLFIGDEALSSKCIGDVAGKTRNIDTCHDLLSLESDGSWELCVSAVALAKKDVSLCNEIKNNERKKSDCLFDIAAINGKYEICDDVPKKDFDHCVLEASGKADDASYCDKLGAGNNKKYVCIRNVALNTKDASFCVDNLRDDEYGLGQCMGVVVQTHRNKRVCSFIDDPEMEKKCLTYFN